MPAEQSAGTVTVVLSRPGEHAQDVRVPPTAAALAALLGGPPEPLEGWPEVGARLFLRRGGDPDRDPLAAAAPGREGLFFTGLSEVDAAYCRFFLDDSLRCLPWQEDDPQPEAGQGPCL